MRRLLLVLLIQVCCIPSLWAADEERVNFQDHILPIFKAKCGTCHSADAAKGGLVVENFQGAMAGGASGAVIEPGNLDDSRLWLLVTHAEQPAMPPKEPKLPEDQLALIKRWIEGGAPETKTSVVKVAKPKMTLAVAEVTGDKPEGPPPMPENVPAETLVPSPRGNSVTAMAASPWAPLAAVAGFKQIILYDLTDFTIVGILPYPEGNINVLRFSRNGTLLLAGGGRGGQSGRCIGFDVKTGKRVFEIGNEFDAVLAADISMNHRKVALGGPKKLVRVYSTVDGELQYEIKKHTDWVTALEFSPDGVLLATGDRSNGLFVWEADTGREFYNLQSHQAAIVGVSWRIDSNVLASISEDATLRVWEMANGSHVKGWGAHGGGGESVQFTRDGRLVSTGRDQVTKLWDQNGAAQRQFPALGEVGMKVAYSEPTGYVLAGDWAGRIRIWKAADGVEVALLATNPAPLQARIDEATKAAEAATAASQQSANQVAALTKQLTDKKAAADAAKAASDAAAAAAKTAEDVRVAQEKELAVKLESYKAGDAALQQALAALEKNKADKAVAAVKSAIAESAAARVAAEKQYADVAAAAKVAADAAAAAKAAADKAAADAVATPEYAKMLADAQAAAKVAADAAAARQAIVAKLSAQKALPPAEAVATEMK